MTASSLKEHQGIQLNDRFLWVDGESTFPAADIERVLFKHSDIPIFVDEITPEIKQYNDYASSKITVKSEGYVPTPVWNIPPYYAEINLKEYLIERLVAEQGLTVQEIKTRTVRVLYELTLYEKYNLTSVLQTLIYIVNTLTENNIVWGIGRGSAVASYVLYLIGVHDVDSVLYDLDIHDFLRDPETNKK